MKLRHIVELDGFRGIAALAVFFHHISFATVHPAWLGPTALRVYSVSRYGRYGVDLFFVLSGYLITTILLQDRSSKNYYHNFYWKRALRILPLYMVALLATWIWFQASTGGIIVGIFFLANFAAIFHVNLAGPFWTLAIEEQFYLIWPQFVRRLNVDRLQKLAVAIVIGEPILRLIAAALHHDNFDYTFFRCDGLALGALLACQLYRKDRAAFTSPKPRGKISGLWVLLIGCTLAAATRQLMDSPAYAMFGFALFLSAINLSFYGCIRIAVENSGARLLAVFRSSVLVFFGQISYCMYMSHTYVMRTYDNLRGPLVAHSHLEYWIRIAAVFGATIVICLISRYALELPFMSLRKYVLHKPARTVDAVEVAVS